MDLTPINVIIPSIVPVIIDNASEWPAWIQAWGTIVAIFATWGLTLWQLHSTKRHGLDMQIAALCDQLNAVQEVAQQMYDKAHETATALTAFHFVNISTPLDRCRNLNTIFGQVELHRYPLTLIAIDAISLKNCSDDFLDRANRQLSFMQMSGPEINASFIDRRDSTNNALKAFDKSFTTFTGAVIKWKARLENKS